MPNQSILVRVPATVGNFGGAMNCSALALEASLNVKVTPRADGRVGIRYFGESGERVPRDRSNLIVRAFEAALHLRELEFTGADFEIYSSVPVAVGLGSSTAAVLAGLIAADRLFRLELDEKMLFDLATIYESRGDNLRAAWSGGFVACTEESPEAIYRRTSVPEKFTLTVVVPETPMNGKTERERTSRRSSRAERLASFNRAARVSDWLRGALAGDSPQLELPLPPTCKKRVPGLDEALKVRTAGLLDIFVCGSGPAVGILQESACEAVKLARECFARNGVEARSMTFQASNTGAREWNAVYAEVGLPSGAGGAAAKDKAKLLPV